ncbi:MAG: L,D-transpeptidase family protein [Clostridiales bacterium]
MKKFLAGLLVGALLFSAIPLLAAAGLMLTPVEYPVLVNGAEYTDQEYPLLNYEGRTYLPLAKIGDLLKVKYLWNEEKSQVEIGEAQVFDVSKLKAAEDADKLVITVGQAGPHATIYAYEKTDGAWVEKYKMEGFVGRNGITSSKREGDGETPAGVYSLSKPFGTAADPGSLLPYTQLTANDFWVDDADSKYYNMWAYGDAADKDWNSAEDLSKETVAYKYAMVIDYNMDPIVKGDGSAIFLHCSTDGATAGCVSVGEEDMIKLLQFIDGDTKMVIAQSVRELNKY